MHKHEINLYWSNQDQAFAEELPELPGCVAHDGSREEALGGVNDAM